MLVKQVRRGCNQMYTFVLEPGGGRRSTRHLEVIVKQKFSTLEQTLPNKNVTYTPGGGKKNIQNLFSNSQPSAGKNYRVLSVDHTFTRHYRLNSEKASGVFSVTISTSQCKQVTIIVESQGVM